MGFAGQKRLNQILRYVYEKNVSLFLAVSCEQSYKIRTSVAT
jgi:hypothetical protein